MHICMYVRTYVTSNLYFQEMLTLPRQCALDGSDRQCSHYLGNAYIYIDKKSALVMRTLFKAKLPRLSAHCLQNFNFSESVISHITKVKRTRI